MGLLYWRAGRLTDKNGGFWPRAEKLEGLGTAEDGLSACCADDAGQAVTWRASSGVCFLPGPAQASVQARPGRNHFDRNNQCKQPDGSAYGRVNWSIDVPNGVYSTVEADCGEELDAWSKLRRVSSATRVRRRLQEPQRRRHLPGPLGAFNRPYRSP
jgi:hypothetical protein